METMNLHRLVARVTDPEQHPRPLRSGLGGALAASLNQTRLRNQRLAAAFGEGYERAHSDDPDPEQPGAAEPVDAMGAASLAALFTHQPTEEGNAPPPTRSPVSSTRPGSRRRHDDRRKPRPIARPPGNGRNPVIINRIQALRNRTGPDTGRRIARRHPTGGCRPVRSTS
jgi:hypothetical protein